MTIDEAIKIADAISEDAFEIWRLPKKGFLEFSVLCADALRLAKKTRENAGISATPVQDTWQERMKREYRETKQRYDKLNRLLVKHAAGTLDFTLKCPIELLKAQCEHMSDYLYTLEIRAEIEGVNLYD